MSEEQEQVQVQEQDGVVDEKNPGLEQFVDTPEIQINKNEYYQRALEAAESRTWGEDDEDNVDVVDVDVAEDNVVVVAQKDNVVNEKNNAVVVPGELQEESKKESERWEKLLNKESQILKHKTELTKFEGIKKSLEEGDYDKVLESLGLNYEKLTQYYLTDPASNTDLLSEKFDAFKSEQEQKIETLQRQLAQKDYESKKAIHMKKIAEETGSDTSDRWEVLKTVENYQDEILAYQEGIYNRTQKIVSIKEAADILENELVEQRTSMKFTPKLLNKLGVTKQQQQQKRRTNFNSVNNSTTSAVSQKENTEPSMEERRRRAMAAISD